MITPWKRIRSTAAAVGLAAMLAGSASRGQEVLAPSGRSEILDQAGLFGPSAVRSATAALRRTEAEVGFPIWVQTIEALAGESLDEAAVERSRKLGGPGLIVLIARRDRKLEVYATAEVEGRMPASKRQAVRDVFLKAFMADDYDGGLGRGVLALRDALGLKPATVEGPQSGDAPEAPLVARNQVRLTLAGARVILAAAEAKAAAMNLKVNIAVVDDGGHLLTFARMEGARPASGYTAITKATTAATFRQATGPLPPGTANPDPLLNISVQNAAAASGGKITTLFGGIPVQVEGQTIGAVGVGGATGEQDAEIARAGVAALVEQLGDAP